MGPLQTENSSLFVAHKQNWPRTPLNQTRGAWSFPPVKTTTGFLSEYSMLEFSEKPFNPNLMSGLNSCFLCCGCVSVFSSLYVCMCVCVALGITMCFVSCISNRRQREGQHRSHLDKGKPFATLNSHHFWSLVIWEWRALGPTTAFFSNKSWIIQLVLPGTPVELFESG